MDFKSNIFNTDLSKNINEKILDKINENDGSYIQTILDICEQHNIEPNQIAKYLSKPILERIRVEAEEKHLLPTEHKTKLPL